MKDLSTLISIIRTEAKFHDLTLKEYVFALFNELNEDWKKGGYIAPPPTVEAFEALIDYMAEREEKRAKLNDRSSRAVVKGMEDEDEF